jgi:2-phospho-L-lactate guanylyltransferase (CobY/MobA/RfbA family)
MKFDIDETLAQMLAAIKDNLKDNWKMIKAHANTYLQNRKSRLELLASLRLANEIKEEFYLKRLKDEKKILESELHSIAIVSKSIAQKAANAAIEVLQDAVGRMIRL